MSAFVDFDLSEVERAITRFHRDVLAGAGKAVEAAVIQGVAESRARRRYMDRTGQLTATADGFVTVRNARGAWGMMWWPAKYASFVEGGTRPHEIRGRRGGNLAFDWPKAGIFFVGRKVNHPGTKAYGFAGDAYLKAERVLVAYMESAIAAASSKL